MGTFRHELAEPEFLPPTVNYAPLHNILMPIRENNPDIKLDGRDMPAFHPILTTDLFEFGTSLKHLEEIGSAVESAVEMGDAVLGLVVEERTAASQSTPRWLVVRNCSEPQINGRLRSKPAGDVGGLLLPGFGYWTSMNSALAC